MLANGLLVLSQHISKISVQKFHNHNDTLDNYDAEGNGAYNNGDFDAGADDDDAMRLKGEGSGAARPNSPINTPQHIQPYNTTKTKKGPARPTWDGAWR